MLKLGPAPESQRVQEIVMFTVAHLFLCNGRICDEGFAGPGHGINIPDAKQLVK
jgi:hypothetical protein